MIIAILATLVIAQGIVTLAMTSVKNNEIRGLQNQVKMRDDRIDELDKEQRK